MDGEQEASLTEAELASLTGRYGASWKAWELGGRRYAVRKPTRAQWQSYKCDQLSPDLTTKADAGVTLARGCLVPIDPSGSVEDERKAFDAMGEESPALLDLLAVLTENLAAGPLAAREVKPPPSTPRA
jgi:hypothetical protein